MFRSVNQASEAGRNGYMDAGSEPTSLRPSQEDGTFTQGKLPQITITITNMRPQERLIGSLKIFIYIGEEEKVGGGESLPKPPQSLPKPPQSLRRGGGCLDAFLRQF